MAAKPPVEVEFRGNLDENLVKLALLGHARIVVSNNETARALVKHMKSNHRPLPATRAAILAHRSKRFYRRTGALQDSMRVLGTKVGGRQSRKPTRTTVGAGGRKAPYAVFVELGWGTKGGPGRGGGRPFPFMQPALDALKGEYFVETGKAANRQIRDEV